MIVYDITKYIIEKHYNIHNVVTSSDENIRLPWHTPGMSVFWREKGFDLGIGYVTGHSARDNGKIENSIHVIATHFTIDELLISPNVRLHNFGKDILETIF